jgi:hypothetical protein
MYNDIYQDKQCRYDDKKCYEELKVFSIKS